MTIEQFLEQLKKLDRAVVMRKIETIHRKQAEELRLSLERQERRLVGGAIERYQQLFTGPRDVRDIPVIINSRNRLASLVALIDVLERTGVRNIFILDNDSEYPPLLQYFERTRHRVLRHGANRGPWAFWYSPFWRMFRNDYYVYTDPDVVPCEDCPLDFMHVFYDTLRKHRHIDKVGFGLRIDDLPEYVDRAAVISWEKVFWEKQVDGLLYNATIDTTFALYRPRARGGSRCKAYRTGTPYLARHMPWYANPQQPTEEDEFYARTAKRNLSHYLTSTDPSTPAWGHGDIINTNTGSW